MSRAIDAMVAEKVMGRTLSEGKECGCCGGQGAYPQCGHGREGRRTRPTMKPCPQCQGAKRLGIVRAPHYSTDPAACRELIDHHQTGFVEIHNGWGEVNGERVGGWHCRIVPPGPHEGVAREPTLEMAVCVASLRAEGVPESEIEKARTL